MSTFPNTRVFYVVSPNNFSCTTTTSPKSSPHIPCFDKHTHKIRYTQQKSNFSIYSWLLKNQRIPVILHDVSGRVSTRIHDPVTKFDEKCSLQWFYEVLCHHCASWTVFHSDLLGCNSIPHKIIKHIYMACLFPATLHSDCLDRSQNQCPHSLVHSKIA